MIVETSERRLSEVMNDEVSPEINRALQTHRGLHVLRRDSKAIGEEGEESSSEAVLLKTVRQLQRDAVKGNKTRFLEFHQSVTEAAKSSNKLKYKLGESLRHLRLKKIEQREKEKARRSALGLTKVKIPEKSFFKISKPMKCVVRPIIQNQKSENKSQNHVSTINLNALVNLSSKADKDDQRVNKKNKEPVSAVPAILSYSRFLCRELGYNSLKGNQKEKTHYVPIRMYDKPPHEWFR